MLDKLKLIKIFKSNMRLQLSTLFLCSLLFFSTQTLFSYSQIQAITGLSVKEFAISSQTHKLVLGTHTGEVYVYTQMSGLLTKKQKLVEVSNEIVAIDITANGQWLMVVDAVNNAYIYKCIQKDESFELYKKVEIDGVKGVASGAMCENHETIAVGGEDGKVVILNFRKSLIEEKQIQNYNQLIKSIKFNAQCSSMVVQTDTDASLYTLPTAELVKTIPFTKMSKKTGSNIAILDHADFGYSKVKILTDEFMEEKTLEFKLKIDQISLTENLLILVSDKKVIFYSRENYEKVYEVDKNIIKYELSEDENLMAVQTEPQTLQIYMRNTFMLTQNQQKVSRTDTKNTLAWEWIMIIVVGCFLFVVFLALIIYEWGYNTFRENKIEEVKMKKADSEKEIKEEVSAEKNLRRRESQETEIIRSEVI